MADRLLEVGQYFAGLSRLANAAVVLGALVGVPFIGLSTTPSQTYSLAQLNPQTERTLVLIGADGQPFARRGGCVAEPIKVAELPQHFVDALLSMEDRRFYIYFGVDPVGAVRAAYRNWRAGRIVEGGSTLTQQLVKVSYLSSMRTYDRKAQEALLAVWLEMRLSKHEILEGYLSSVYFGEGCYGLRAAAQRYFDKPVSHLTLPESAYLVGLLRAPSYLARNADAAQARARLVLQAMVANGRLDRDRLSEIEPAMPQIERPEPFGAHYADWVAGTVQAPKNGNFAPLPVRTAFEPRLQRAAQEAIESILSKEGERRRASQGALVAMRPDGRVVAMVGGRDYGSSQFNRAVQALRQPGSAFKTFVYFAALRAGADVHMTVYDEPIRIGNYEPRNFGESFRGAVSLRQAFASSINTVAVQLSEAVGRDEVIAAARDLGITTPLAPLPSVALGAWEVTLLELTSAYAAIAADAYPVLPWGVATLGENTLQPGGPPTGAGRWRLEARDKLKGLLETSVRHGTSRGARLAIPSFGKTGTSQEFRDAWFIGFAGNLVVGVWVGNDDNSPMRRVTGGSLPAQIWRNFMTVALDSDPGFERQPQRIAAFEAQPRQRVTSSNRLAALKMLERGGADRDWIGRGAVAGWSSGARFAERELPPPARARSAPRRAAPAGSFQHQLREMGWPRP